MKKHSTKLLAAVLCALAAAPGGRAATIQWSGGAGGAGSAWLTAGNWFPTTYYPNTNDVAVFSVTGTSTTIDINLGQAPGATQMVGLIQLVAGTNRTIQNNSTSSNGVLQFNGAGSPVIISNGATAALLHFRNSATTSPVTMRLMLNTNGVIYVNSGVLVTASNTVIAEMGGARTLTKSGGGTLTLGAANTYSGGTTIENGPNTQTAGAINLLSFSALGGGAVTFANTASFTPLYFAAAGSGTLSNNIALSGTAGITTRLLAGSANTFIATLGGVISGGEATQILQIDNDNATDQGRIRFSNAANSFRVGYINLNRGGLVFDSDGALGDTNNTLRLDVSSADGTTGLIFGNNVTLPESRTMLVNSMTRIDSQSFTGTVLSVITNNAALRKSGTGAIVLNGLVSGSGGFTVESGTLVLNAANTLTGGHTNAATIALGVDNALGSGQLDLRGTNGVTRSVDANARSIGNNLNIATDTAFGSAGTGDLTINGTTYNNGGAAKRLAISNSVTTFNGIFNNSGIITKSGPGLMVLNSADAVRSPFIVAEGPVSLGASATMPAAPSITVSNGASLDVSAPTLTLNGATNQILQGFGIVTGQVTVNNGAQIQAGFMGQAGTLTIDGDIYMNAGVTNTFDLTNNVAVGGGNDLLVAGIANFEPASSWVRINPIAPLAGGTYRLVNYSGSKTTTFSTPVLGNTTRSTWTLDESVSTQINLIVSATNAALVWSASTSADWDLGSTNWIVIADGTTDRFYDVDTVLFDDSGAASNVVNITTTVRPLTLTVNSSSNYTFGGAGAIADVAGSPLQFVKDGSGTLIVLNTNSYGGPTTINNGTLQIGNGGGATNGGGIAAMGSSPYTVNAPGVLAFFRTNLASTINNTISGNGTVVFRGAGTSTNESGYSLGGNNAAFGGSMIVTNARLQLSAATQIGTNQTIEVQSGGSVFQSAGTFGAPITLNGIGWWEGAGNLGAVRVENATNTGPVTLAGNARIGAYSANGTVNGTISGPYELELWDGSATSRSLTLTPAGQNAYASVRISDKIVAVAGNANAFGTGPVIMNGGTQRLAGFSFAISNLTSTAAGGTITCGAGTPSTLTIGLDDSSTAYGGIFANPVGVSGAILHVTKVGAGTLTLNGTNLNTGNFTVQTGAVALGASGSISNAATVVLAGGVFDVTPKVSGYSPQHVIKGNGTVSGAVHLAAANVFRPGDSGAPGTITVSGSLDMTSTNVLTLDLTNSTTAGSGINDLIQVNGNLEPSNSVISINALAPLASGVYTLFTYTGAKLSDFNTNVLGTITRKSWTLDTNTAGQVNLIVGGDYGALTWRPGLNAVWDLGTSNWFNSVNSSTDRFYHSDAVLFDDTGAYSNVVTLATSLQPASLVVDAASNYVWTGTGKVSGAIGMTKLGSGMLTISNANDFNGPIYISNGVVKVGNANALGNNVGETIVNGGTVDLQSLALNGVGERFVISGTGLGSTGAVVSSGGSQQDSVRYVTLAGDASIGAWTTGNRWDIRGPGGSGSFNGEVNLNGFTVTKIGPGRVSMIDSTITNAGSIVVQEGMFEFSRDIISGPGSVSLLPNTSLFFENYGAGSMTKTLTMDSATITNSGNTFTLGSPVILTNANTFVIALNMTMTNVISGPGSLVKTGVTNLILTASNTYAGGTILSAGYLQLGNGGADGSVLGSITNNNGTLIYRRSDTIMANPISGAGNLYVNVASGLVFDASTPMSGRLNINVPFQAAGMMIVQPGASIVCTNIFLGNQNSFPGTVVQHGGDVVVGGHVRIGHWPTETSTYQLGGGAITITNDPGVPLHNSGSVEQSGALYIGIDGTGIFIQTGGVVRCAGVVLDNRGDTAGADTLVLEGGSMLIGRWGISSGTNLTTAVLLGGGSIVAYDNWTSSVPAQLTGTNGSTIVDAAAFTITMSSPLSGTGGLSKAGTGTLLLNASSTYTGPMTVGAGRLFGSGSVNSAVVVNEGATLGPSLLSTTPGLLTVGSASVVSGAQVNAFMLGTNPTLRVTGNVTSAPGSILQVIALSPITNTGTHVLVDYDGVFTGDVADFVFGGVPNGGQGYLTNNLANTSIDLVVTNVGTGVIWDGLVNSSWKHGGPQNWKSRPGGTPAMYNAFDNVIFDDTAAGTTNVTLAEVVAPSSIIVSNATTDYLVTGGGISGSAGLTKFGAAKFSISGTALSYTGLTQVIEGTLKLDSVPQLNGGIANSSTTEFYSASGSWTMSATGRTISGAGVFKKTGAGTTLIGGASVGASGLITVEQGTLGNDGNSSVWTGSTARLDVSAGANFDMRGDPVNIETLTGLGTVTNSLGNSGGENLTLGANNSPIDITTVIQDSGRVGSGEGSGSINILKLGTGDISVASADLIRAGLALDRGNAVISADQPGVQGLAMGGIPGSTNLSFLDLSSASLTAMSYSNIINSASTSRIVIGASRALTINGSVYIGAPTNNPLTRLEISGPGSFIVSHTNALFKVGNAKVLTDNDSRAMLDMSNLAYANINLGAGSLTIGSGDNSTLQHFLLLAATNIISANSVRVGASGMGGQQVMRLGTVSNIFNVDYFTIGDSNRDWGVVSFGSPGGSFVLRDRSGTGRASFSMGPTINQTTGYAMTNLFDVTAHNADMLISTLNIGLFPHGPAAPTVTNTFLFDTGILDATAVQMAMNINGDRTNACTMIIGGGTANIGAGGIILASNGVGCLQLNGGIVTCGGNIARAIPTSVVGRASFFLSGASLDLQGNKLGGTPAINVLSFESGALANVAEINAGAPLNKTTSGTLTLAGTNQFTGIINVSNGTLIANGAKTGSGDVNVSAGATLGGSGTIAGSQVINGGTVAPGTAIGILTLLGDYFDAGALAIELAGTTPGTGHDQLVVGGTATLSGSLNVTTNGGFAPVAGNTFTVLTASAISGTFATTTLPVLSDPNLGWSVVYAPAGTPTMVILSVTGAPTGPVGYDLWAGAITNGLTNYNESATGDGYPNLLKYATGSNPTNADNIAQMNRTTTNGMFALKFTRNTNATDLTLIIEGAFASTNEATWNGIATNVHGSWGATTNYSENTSTDPAGVVVWDTATATNRFLRLRVTRP